MSKIEIQLDTDGVRELLQSDEMADFCEELAEQMTRATGMEYKPDVRVGKYRVRVGAYQERGDTDD